MSDRRVPKTNPGKAGLAFIMIAVLLDVLSLGVVIPIIAKLIKQLLNDSTADAAAYVGWFGTVWAFMQFFSSPIMGALSDRFGRRPVLLISGLGLGLDYILMALAPNLTWLFIGRVLTGITAASFSTASAYIADVTPPEKRSAAFGIYGAAFGLGFIIGPALGGYLGTFDLRLPFWVSAGLTLTNTCYGYFILPESLPPEKRSPFRWSRANPIGSLNLLRSYSGLLPMAIILFCYQLAHNVFSTVFVLYTDERFNWSTQMVGSALAVVGVLNFIVQGALIRPAVRLVGERILVYVGLLGGIIGFIAYFFIDGIFQRLDPRPHVQADRSQPTRPIVGGQQFAQWHFRHDWSCSFFDRFRSHHRPQREMVLAWCPLRISSSRLGSRLDSGARHHPIGEKQIQYPSKPSVKTRRRFSRTRQYKALLAAAIMRLRSQPT